jgi:hypothetical protein
MVIDPHKLGYAFGIILKLKIYFNNLEENNMNYELIKKNYDRGLWSKRQVEIAKEKGVITEEEYQKITEGAK